MIASGTRIRQYEILSLIGAGGMGEVYLAMDHTLGRRVAMKFLAPQRTEDERADRRLLQEARAAVILLAVVALAATTARGSGRPLDVPIDLRRFLLGQTRADGKTVEFGLGLEPISLGAALEPAALPLQIGRLRDHGAAVLRRRRGICVHLQSTDLP
jgi:hypothetical protein